MAPPPEGVAALEGDGEDVHPGPESTLDGDLLGARFWEGSQAPTPLGPPFGHLTRWPVCGKMSPCFVHGLFAGPRFVLLPEAWQAASSLQRDHPLCRTRTPQEEGIQRNLAEEIVLLCGGRMWGCGARALDQSCPHTLLHHAAPEGERPG